MLTQETQEKQNNPLLNNLLYFIQKNAISFDTNVKWKSVAFWKSYIAVFNEWKWFYLNTHLLENLDNDILKDLSSKFPKALRQITSTRMKLQAYLINNGFKSFLLESENKVLIDSEIKKIQAEQAIIAASSSVSQMANSSLQG